MRIWVQPTNSAPSSRKRAATDPSVATRKRAACTTLRLDTTNAPDTPATPTIPAKKTSWPVMSSAALPLEQGRSLGERARDPLGFPRRQLALVRLLVDVGRRVVLDDGGRGRRGWGFRRRRRRRGALGGGRVRPSLPRRSLPAPGAAAAGRRRRPGARTRGS